MTRACLETLRSSYFGLCRRRWPTSASTRAHITSASHCGWGADTLSIEVRDDGTGFNSPRATGFGITTMTTRVRDVGGTVELTSKPGRGTTLRVAIPSDRQRPEAVLDER